MTSTPDTDRSDRDYWIAMGLFALVTFVFIVAHREPAHHEYRLGFWLGYLTSDRPERREMAVSALRQMGDSALPHLLRMVEFGDTNLQAQAVLAFVAMDGRAQSATPQLEQLLRNEAASLPAARALAGIGRSSLPVLTNALASEVRYVRNNAARGLGLLHSDAQVAVPLLIHVLDDQDDDLRFFASRALGYIAERPDQTVPALVTRLVDSNLEVRKIAARSLAQFHARAKTAVPALLKALASADDSFKETVAFALEEIDPDTAVEQLK